ncbi:Gfo/Idh/MocA family oxidoreductase [Paenibacillus sp. CC-CFT747]|nr:Gfo/Idh/MocA family oxidoreductase [Paenibacillus sp. CC-CFT747]
MSNRTFGIIGCQHGHIAGFLTEMLRLGHRCAGISETGEPALAERLSLQHGIPLVKEARSLLEDPEVSVIGSSAVNAFKLDVIEQCEAYGKHVMLDKPIAVNRHQLERLEGVIGRGGIQIGMMLTERFRPVLYTLSRMLEREELGKVVSLTMRKPHKLTPSSRHAWHFSKEQNGGIVMDLFVHDFDLLRWLTGQEIRSVQTVVTKNGMPEYPTFYDTACAQVVMDGERSPSFIPIGTPPKPAGPGETAGFSLLEPPGRLSSA